MEDMAEIRKVRSQSLRRLLQLYYVLYKQEELPSKRELVARVRKNFNVSRASAYDYANTLLFILSHPSSVESKKGGMGLEKYLPEWLNLSERAEPLLPKVFPLMVKLLNIASFEGMSQDYKRRQINRYLTEIRKILMNPKNHSFQMNESFSASALSHHVAFGENLETVSQNFRYRVVAKVSRENGKPDEVPVRQIQVITEMIDPPLMKNMLNYGSYLLKELGYDRDMVKNHILADYYGRLLRKLAVYLMDKKLSVPPNQVVHAALFYLLTKTDMKKAQEMLKKFPFDKKYLRIVALVANLALI